MAAHYELVPGRPFRAAAQGLAGGAFMGLILVGFAHVEESVLNAVDFKMDVPWQFDIGAIVVSALTVASISFLMGRKEYRRVGIGGT